MNNICTISFGALLISSSSTLMADTYFDFSIFNTEEPAQIHGALSKTSNSETNSEGQSHLLPSFRPDLPESERFKRWEALKLRIIEARKKSELESLASANLRDSEPDISDSASESLASTSLGDSEPDTSDSTLESLASTSLGDSEFDISDSDGNSNKLKEKKFLFIKEPFNFFKNLFLNRLLSIKVSEIDNNKVSSQTLAMLEKAHLEEDIQELEVKRADKKRSIETLKEDNIRSRIQILENKKNLAKAKAEKTAQELQTSKKSIIAWLKSSKVRSEQKNLRLKAKEAEDELQKAKVEIQLEENKLDSTFIKLKLKQESQELFKIGVSLNQLLLKKSKLDLTITKNSEKAFKGKNITLELEAQKNIRRLNLEIIQLEGKLKYEKKFKKDQRKLEDGLNNLNMNKIEEVDAYFVFLNSEARKLIQTRDKMLLKNPEKYAEKIYYIEKLLEIIKRNRSIVIIQSKYTQDIEKLGTIEQRL